MKQAQFQKRLVKDMREMYTMTPIELLENFWDRLADINDIIYKESDFPACSTTNQELVYAVFSYILTRREEK